MLPKRLLPERPGATSSQPGDLLHIPASREVAILLLASSRAGLPPGTWAQGSAGHRIPLTFSLTCLWPSAQLTCPPPPQLKRAGAVGPGGDGYVVSSQPNLESCLVSWLP